MLNDDEQAGIPRLFLYSALIMGAAIMCVSMWYGVLPGFMDAERESVTHSRQYVTSQRSAILALSSECHQLVVDIALNEEEGGHESLISAQRSQLSALELQLNEHLSNIPESEHPAGSSTSCSE